MTDHDTEDHLEEIPLDALPLDAWHRARGARMVPFAGYEMPVQYPLGVLKEHLWTREKAGLFDADDLGGFERGCLRRRCGSAARIVVDQVAFFRRHLAVARLGLFDHGKNFRLWPAG